MFAQTIPNQAGFDVMTMLSAKLMTKSSIKLHSKMSRLLLIKSKEMQVNESLR